MRHQSPPWPKGARAWVKQSLLLADRVHANRGTPWEEAYGKCPEQCLDIYQPDCVGQPLPVVIFVHGGYHTNGSKRLCAAMAPGITALPAIFVSVGYRLAPAVSIQEQVQDIQQAVAWLYQHIHAFGGNADHMYLAGHSSGGLLATYSALHIDELEQLGCPSDVIKACMPVSGVYDLTRAVARITRYVLRPGQLASRFSANQSPDANYVPFLLTVSENEFPLLREMHDSCYQHLRRSPAAVDELIFSGTDHFSVTFALTQKESPWLNYLRRHILSAT